MKEIELTQGYKAIIDDEDFERISKHKWQIDKKKYGLRYAMRKQYVSKGKIITIRMHTEILGSMDGLVIDHINGDGLDNRKDNLRFLTHSENWLAFTRKKGYSYCKEKNKWRARCIVHKKLFHLGDYSRESDAKKAVKSFRDNMLKVLIEERLRNK